jgi:hypothetical protein
MFEWLTEKPKQSGLREFIFKYIWIIFFGVIVFTHWNESFFEHFWSELAGIALSIFIAVVVIDEYKKHTWKRIKKHTSTSLVINLYEILEKLYIQMPFIAFNAELTEILLRDKSRPSHKISNAFNEVAKIISGSRVKNWEREASSGSVITASDISVKYFNKIRSNLDEIRYTLTPIIIDHSDDDNLIEALVEFEIAIANLQSSIAARKINTSKTVLPELAIFIEKSGQIYRTIIDNNYLTVEQS